ncbi:chloride channel protein [Iamia sp. SCSIO 61187]|uniref:chloride channel protein n=1 Tax=Iamia sp. SCSIO 61187 TaxID=2722752 RepID=UPI001C63357C|nr:chloride channel protein [Iamia sp. SCSIO 61187]QYG92487.1 chloride channel protein [Iamia sp. SCSIO 61187]
MIASARWERFLPGGGREHLVDLGRRSQQVLGVAGVTGVVVGLLVAGFEGLAETLTFERVLDLPLAVQAGAPAVGLALTALILRIGGSSASPSTSDDYIRAFHDTRGGRLRLRDLPIKLLASVATLGSGVPLGHEGPAIYAGASLGAAAQRRLSRLFSAEQAKLLMVAGAAAGVSAVFKAPVTGLVFALEVPFQDDLARRMVLPAAISSAASYVTFASLAGTEPLLPVAGRPPFNLVDLGGAAVIGLVAGCLARVFVSLIRHAKTLSGQGHPVVRVAGAGATLAVVVLAGHALGDGPLGLGPGYNALRWALEPEHSVVAIVALGTLRVAGTAAAVAGGGTGGLFIPLVIQGALVGRAVGGVFDMEGTSLFPVVGMAAFLGAGYRVPLAAVVFVAEFTGQPGFVVPGLIAAVVAQLVMGRASISPYQSTGRVGHLEHRLRMPLTLVVDSEARTVPPDATVDELFWHHLVGTRQQSVPVVDGDTYLGMAEAHRLAQIDRESWPTTTVAEAMRTGLPVAGPDWLLSDAIRAMEASDTDRLAVCDDGRFIGVITAADLVRLDEIIDATEGDPDRRG